MCCGSDGPLDDRATGYKGKDGAERLRTLVVGVFMNDRVCCGKIQNIWVVSAMMQDGQADLVCMMKVMIRV
jgi:hypothetical protein